MEVCSGRFRKGFLWTIRCSMMRRFAPVDFVKVLSGRCGEHEEVCSGRFRKGFIWKILGSMWKSAPDSFVKVLSRRCEVSCECSLQMISSSFDLDDLKWHVEVCPGRCRKGSIWTIRKTRWRFGPGHSVKGLFGRCGVACGGSLRTSS